MAFNPKNATLHDVARQAGVSYQTVSRVINNSPNVRAETRQRVLQVIAEIGYRPNRSARTLITGRSQTIQVIMFEAFYHWTLEDYVYRAEDAGFHVAMSSLIDQHSVSTLQQQIDERTGQTVDGFVFVNPELSLSYEELIRISHGLPFVQSGGNPCDGVPAVVFDQPSGVEKIVDHLVQLGHRRFAEITGMMNSYDGRIRHETFCRLIAEKGLILEGVANGSFTLESGYQAANELLDRGIHFTALVCGNDKEALGAMRAITERGLRIPEDISVVGFDNDEHVSYHNPPLTTIYQNHAELGRQVIEYLVALIKNPHLSCERKVIYPPMMVRQSTGPAK